MASTTKPASPDDKLIPSLPQFEEDSGPASSIEQATADDDNEEDEIENEEDGVLKARVAQEEDEEDSEEDDEEEDDEDDEDDDVDDGEDDTVEIEDPQRDSDKQRFPGDNPSRPKKAGRR